MATDTDSYAFLYPSFNANERMTAATSTNMKPLNALILACCLFMSICSCHEEEPEVTDNLAIALDKSELTIEIGKSERLTAYFSPSDAPNTAHEWRTSNPAVAKVDDTGMVTAVAPGQAEITAVALANGATATCEVLVVDKIIYPTSVSFGKSEEFVLVGESIKLEAIVSPENSNAKSLTWSSTDNSVATVNNDGTVHGIAIGSAEISATTSNNKVAKCKITVGDKTVYFSDVTIDVIDDTSVRYSFTATPRGVAISEVGICIDTDKTPTIESTSFKSNNTSGSFSGTLTKLTPNTRYFFRAYAKGNSNVYYSATTVFTTQGSIKTNFKVTAIYYDQLDFITPVIPGVDLKVGYGVAPHPEITDNLTTVTKDGDNYNVVLNNLERGTTYYLRAYSINNGKVTYYSNEGCASTFGTNGQNITIHYHYSFPPIGYTPSDYCCLFNETDLPSGKYEVAQLSKKGNGITKTEPDESKGSWQLEKQSIYISGGIDNFYAIEYQIANRGYNVTFLYTITNIETGLTYYIEDSFVEPY